MKRLLVIVDMQNDFISGSLGTDEAKKIEPKVVNKIKKWDGDIVCTMDTHSPDYLSTSEGKKLPVEHCIEGTDGWGISDSICNAIDDARKSSDFAITKPTFGSIKLAEYIGKGNYEYIEFVGLCTDICVISNVLLTKAHFPEATIVVDASCCAGVTVESHQNALNAMKMCQIDVINEEVK